MASVSVLNGAWIFVADHSKAMLLENKGSAIAPRLEVRQVFEAERNPPTAEQGSDGPGTVQAGSHRSHVEQTDWQAIAGRRFLERAAQAVETAKAHNEFKSLVLVAPPKALSELRTIVSPAVKSSIVAELDRDLVHMPVAEIADHLAA